MTPRAVFERIAGWMSGHPRRPGGSRGAGWDWERVAERALVDAGYQILDRNFRAAAGELDFVAEEGGVVCFVEVKGRRGVLYGSPEDAVTAEKQRRIFRAAEAWLLRRRRGSAACRFDVVSILEGADGRKTEIFRDAFRGPVAPRRRR
ncbi:MAG TPA: YraN family protein [Thermoanaerobaculia bacterium]|nr:YraN family protein [Thermoanaerobaculia bacterium]